VEELLQPLAPCQRRGEVSFFLHSLPCFSITSAQLRQGTRSRCWICVYALFFSLIL
jgi:hypothetical protein